MNMRELALSRVGAAEWVIDHKADFHNHLRTVMDEDEYQDPGAQALTEAAAALARQPVIMLDQRTTDCICRWLEYRAAAMQINNGLAVARLTEQLNEEGRSEMTAEDIEANLDQSRLLSWSGRDLTVKELSAWLNQIPNHAVIGLGVDFHKDTCKIEVKWKQPR